MEQRKYSSNNLDNTVTLILLFLVFSVYRESNVMNYRYAYNPNEIGIATPAVEDENVGAEYNVHSPQQPPVAHAHPGR